jgi:hypothetical protein
MGLDIAFSVYGGRRGCAYVTGETSSTDFPAGSLPADPHGFPNAFVTKVNTNGTGLVYSTYLGGPVQDFGFGIALDSVNRPVVAGFTVSTDFPTRNFFQGVAPNFSGSACITKLTPMSLDPSYLLLLLDD